MKSRQNSCAIFKADDPKTYYKLYSVFKAKLVLLIFKRRTYDFGAQIGVKLRNQRKFFEVSNLKRLEFGIYLDT